MHTLMGLALAGFLTAPPQGLEHRMTLKGHSEAVQCIALSPDGKLLVSAGRRMDLGRGERWAELRLWDTATGKERGVLKYDKGEIERLAISRDGKMLATAGPDYTIKLWRVIIDKDSVSLKESSTIKTGTMHFFCLSFNSDATQIGAADYQRATIWDTKTGQTCASFQRRVQGWSPSFSPDLKILASPNYQDVDLWDTTTGKERGSLLDHRGAVSRVAFVDGGKALLVASTRLDDHRNWHSEVKLWDVATAKERAIVKEHSRMLREFAISADNATLILAEEQEPGGKAVLKLFSLPEARLIHTFSFQNPKESPWSLALSPDGKTLAAGCADGTVRVWSVSSPSNGLAPDRAR